MVLDWREEGQFIDSDHLVVLSDCQCDIESVHWFLTSMGNSKSKNVLLETGEYANLSLLLEISIPCRMLHDNQYIRWHLV